VRRAAPARSSRARIERFVGVQYSRGRGTETNAPTILNAFQVADIRKKILFTAGMLLIYAWVAHTGCRVSPQRGQQPPEGVGGSGILGLLNTFSGGSLAGSRYSRWDHAVHHLLDHPEAAAGVGAIA